MDTLKVEGTRAYAIMGKNKKCTKNKVKNNGKPRTPAQCDNKYFCVL
jgi:hypothetical protein